MTSFILMAWNSNKLVNTARGCLPQKVWICSCWRQGWKAGDCFFVLKFCVLLWASASPDAGGRTLSWVYSMENGTVQKRKGGHPYLCLWRGRWEENVPPYAQAHCAGKPWGHSLWQHPQLHDPLLWVSGPFYSYLILLRWPEVCDLCRHASTGHVARRDSRDPARSSPSYQEQKQDVSCLRFLAWSGLPDLCQNPLVVFMQDM